MIKVILDSNWQFRQAGNEQQGWQYAFVIYGIAAVVFFLIALLIYLTYPLNEDKVLKMGEELEVRRGQTE